MTPERLRPFFPRAVFLGLMLILLPRLAAAQESLSFLPSGHVFKPLVGDPLEPACSIVPDSHFAAYSQDIDASLGASVDLFRWKTADNHPWALGALGVGHLLINRYEWASYEVLADDWYWGFYLSQAAGPFSNRLEWFEMGSHLGDGVSDADIFLGINDHLFGTGFPYTRSGFQWICSFQEVDQLRPYVGLGYWTAMTPAGNPPLYVHGGVELYTDHFDLLGTFGRLYFTYDLKVNDEAAGIVDQYFEWGVQLQMKKETQNTGFRLALTHAAGNNPFGQFFQQNDEYWGIGLFFDP